MQFGTPMENLLQGYRVFRGDRWPVERDRYFKLATEGQKPETLVITCSDSRCDPAMIFNARPGELFVIRNVAGVVPPFESDDGHHGTSAAIAFAVLNLQVRNILVMGHVQCAGVAAVFDQSIAQDVPFLGSWVKLLAPALRAIDRAAGREQQVAALERECVRLSLTRLANFPFVAERVCSGTLELNGARFGIADGRLEILSRDSGRFIELR